MGESLVAFGHSHPLAKMTQNPTGLSEHTPSVAISDVPERVPVAPWAFAPIDIGLDVCQYAFDNGACMYKISARYVRLRRMSGE